MLTLVQIYITLYFTIGLTNFVNNNDGAEKVCKFIQYFARFMIGVFKISNPKLSVLFKMLCENMQDARKLMRLGKWNLGYEKAVESYKNPDPSWDSVDVTINVFSRICAGLNWFFDNLYILARFGVGRIHNSYFILPLYLFWFMSLLFLLVFNIKQLIQVMILKKYFKASNNQTKEIEMKMVPLNKKMRKHTRIIIKILADSVNAGSGCHFFKLFDIVFSDMDKAFAGIVASLLSGYDLYK